MTDHQIDELIAELDEFWCSDCLSRELFDRVVDAAIGSEWACTSCGAAYFDALDLAVEPITDPRLSRASGLSG